MAPVPKMHEYEITYDDFGTPDVIVTLWDQPLTQEDMVYFYLAPEAEVLIYDQKTIDAIQKRDPKFNSRWTPPYRWGDIKKLLEADFSVPLAELKRRRFRVGVLREVWDIPYPRMLSGIVESVRKKNHRRNRQIEDLKEQLGITR